MSTLATSHGDCQPETSIGAASAEAAVMLGNPEKFQDIMWDFASTISTDEDIVCSQVDRDEFKAFVKEQGESDLGKTIRLTDFIVGRDMYRRSPHAGLLKRTPSGGFTIQEAVTMAVGLRNKFFALNSTSKAAWEMFLTSLQLYGIASTSKNKTEALMQSLEGMVPMGVWDQTWKLSMAARGGDGYRASSAMATDLVNL
ncbi:hypothetical protein VF21_05351 [Pseudogymnoascus sp. 05NY08]|nr:hypothetical protein VF21_05351 [Pseudogymnoascus sp. 05NY08]